MAQKFLPTKPKLFVHQSICVVKVNRLERFQELVGAMKETRLIFRGKGIEIFQPSSPDTRHLRIFHESVGYFPHGRRGGILGRNLGHSSAAMHLKSEVKNGQDDSYRANQLRDRGDGFPAHTVPLCESLSNFIIASG